VAQAEFHEVITADREKLFAAITTYEEYPRFVDGCRGVQVRRTAPGKAVVDYEVFMIKDVRYTLEHTEDPQKGRVEWKLVSSDFIRKNVGHWELADAGPGRTDVRYVIEIEFKIPVPGLILNRLVRSSLPSMIRSFEKRANGET
jgi:ribosome-associated toxin RatA of RatAB toxin-antitoxin module